MLRRIIELLFHGRGDQALRPMSLMCSSAVPLPIARLIWLGRALFFSWIKLLLPKDSVIKCRRYTMVSRTPDFLIITGRSLEKWFGAGAVNLPEAKYNRARRDKLSPFGSSRYMRSGQYAVQWPFPPLPSLRFSLPDFFCCGALVVNARTFKLSTRKLLLRPNIFGRVDGQR